MISKTFSAEVVQFKMPHGMQVVQYTELPVSVNPDYITMRNSGYRFEAEMLSTGTVSVTISDSKDDIDSEIISNGPEVQAAMVRMLKRRLWES